MHPHIPHMHIIRIIRIFRIRMANPSTRSKVIVITTDFEVVDNFNPDDAVLSKYFCSMFLRRIVVLSMCKHATALRRQTTQGHGLDLPDYTRSAQICTDLRRPSKICTDLHRPPRPNKICRDLRKRWEGTLSGQ